MQSHIDKCIPKDERVARVAVLFCVVAVVVFLTLPHGQPHAGFDSISGGWMLLCKGLIMAEDSPYIYSAYNNIL